MTERRRKRPCGANAAWCWLYEYEDSARWLRWLEVRRWRGGGEVITRLQVEGGSNEPVTCDSTMNIRSLTIGAALPRDGAGRAALLARLGEFARAGRTALEDAGFAVQSTRLSAQPFERWLSSPADAVSVAAEVSGLCVEAGLDYCSVGTIQAQGGSDTHLHAIQERLADVVIAGPNLFTSVQVGDVRSGGVNLDAVRAAAVVIKRLAEETTDGFGNLRFAAAANCPPHVPFYPASYYVGDDSNRGEPEFGLALEAADLAVTAFSEASTHDEGRENLLALLLDHGDRLAQVCGRLAADHGYSFTGLDISMAPFPEETRSTGHAIELLSGVPLGGLGTLAAGTFFTGVLKDARRRLPTVGYSGMMLPVLEDQTISDRAAEGLVTLDTLLLLSAVCGLGLDTVPLPGDISLRQLERIILDMAALAVRLDKPLTARLFPVAGKAAGDPVAWPDFPYFAKARVMPVPGGTYDAGLIGGGWLAL